MKPCWLIYHWIREDLLKCRLCPYETIQKSNLKLHEATHERGVAGRGKSKGKLKTTGRQPRRAALDDIDDDFDEIEGTIDEIMDAVGGDSWELCSIQLNCMQYRPVTAPALFWYT